ncbi:hypothetical protein FV139_17610 [Parahaliea maris]|uniref:Uncharacterized protein n=1 Tax=Parahaliea maris TaxID=2716870 RepID=A0A5C8ZU44_9GAMM|nr:hypothetical protein [Parahaliea maris]TXS90791.1 hypothetical protein FV139_17610 [Parahaliea maris]
MRSWSSLAELEGVIENGYERLGYRELGDRGYRFLSSPESTLGSSRLIMSINPAGNTPDYENDGMFTAEGTSAYVNERWLSAPMGSSKLQVQYQEMFKLLRWEPLQVLQAPFSPYRHPSWSKLPSDVARETLQFCNDRIWKPYFTEHCPNEIVCVGKPQISALLDSIPYRVTGMRSIETGWNNSACQTATHYFFENDTVIVQIPHLSRFGILTALVCQEHLGDIFSPLL